MPRSKGQFVGTRRFDIRRCLGAGGMGEVYEAYDRESRETVALKTLLRADAQDIYRFKNEFRSLADAAHPNLVSLYELVAEGDQWFFTMELVDGHGFLEHVRGDDSLSPPTRWAAGAAPDDPTVERKSDSSLDPPTSPTVSGLFPTLLPDPTPRSESRGREPAEGAVPRGRVVLDCLRPALGQLVEGVEAIHEMGKLHRDLKPSNVMVTREGRVVILDFGLITEMASGGSEESLGLAGTPIYMSPEQAMGLAVTEVSDRYSVGVMLYEALAGRPPFTGTNVRVLSSKQNSDPPPPSSLTPGVPEDLDALLPRPLGPEPGLAA